MSALINDSGAARESTNVGMSVAAVRLRSAFSHRGLCLLSVIAMTFAHLLWAKRIASTVRVE